MEYSNLGMGLLGHLLAQKAHLSYEGLLQNRITKPLGMNDTSINISEDQRSRLAPPHLADGSSGTNWNIPALAGAGAIRSTTNDMLKFVEANLHPPQGELGKAIDLAWNIHQQPIAEEDFPLGLGWHVARDGSTRWHNGETGGYHAMMLVSRKLDMGVVVLANTATREVDQLAQQIMQMLAGTEVQPRRFAKPVDVDPQVMQRYVGKYELVPGFVFTVSVENKRLMVGATSQPTFEVFPRSDTEWYYQVVEATLTFQVDDKGKCDAVKLFQNGVRHTAKRIE